MKKIFLLILPILLFISCDSTFELIAAKKDATKMERDRSILILSCNNGFYQNKEYKQSGKKTTEMLRNKLRPYAELVEISSKTNIKDFSLEELAAYDYIITPELYHWEDRVTSWNFIPDKVIFGLKIYDSTAFLINHIEIKGESTKVTGGFNDPIDLVNEALDMYMLKLFEIR